MGAAAIPIALAVTGISTGLQVNETRKARKASEKEAKNQREEQNRLEAERRNKEQIEKQRVRSRLRPQSVVTGGRGGTVVTSPLGITGTKTKLGE